MLKVAIIGRANVGKSTLFNRLASKRLAIVYDEPGVTRDIQNAKGKIADLNFDIVDTAGLERASSTDLLARMAAYSLEIINQVDVILFVFDAAAGVTPQDEYFAGIIRRLKKYVILCANKTESSKVRNQVAEGYKLGLGEPIALSAEHGDGINDLYEKLSYYNALLGFNKDDEQSESEDSEDNFDWEGLEALASINEDGDNDDSKEQETNIEIKLAIVGRPNIGKSTLVNRLLGFERMLVGDEAGITRDSIATNLGVEINNKNYEFTIVDTAGMRKNGKIYNKLERIAVSQSIRAIGEADVVLLLLDATLGVEKQDLTIASEAINKGKSLIIGVNKWDMIRDKSSVIEEIRYQLEKSLSQVKGVPILMFSAMTGKGVDKILFSVVNSYNLWIKRIPTSSINRWLKGVTESNPPPMVRGRSLRIKYGTQVRSRPPTLVLWSSRPDEIPSHYSRFLANSFRDTFKLKGICTRIIYRKPRNPYVD